ncbi:MAG: RNA polymerase sigma factor [Bacillota bacterium]|nr:RNA polymerase sigma factor [Bacillota bacterium]MDW7684740.1 RNA polymerase sigma factor [Bacillota bacterium]
MAGIFEELYSTYKKPVFNYLYRCTLNTHTAEELTQETFIRALKYFGSFRGESSAKTWLFKIARNIYLDHCRKYNTHTETDIAKQPVTDPFDAFASVDEQSLINKVLAGLKEDEREMIILRDANGLSYREIAEIMSFTEGQVKIGLFRARRKFRENYQQETEGCK